MTARQGDLFAGGEREALERTFAPDACDRLARSEHDYYSTHGQYVPPLARLLNATRKDRDGAWAQGFDEGQAAIWDELVCASCGRNHDRDESAMCPGGEAVLFHEWVEARRG